MAGSPVNPTEVFRSGWVDEVLTALGRLFRGATAYPRGKGVWRDDDHGGTLIWERTTMRQLVGLNCVKCEQRIGSIVEGQFCECCKHPVCNTCYQTPASIRQNQCSGCGVDLRQVPALPAEEPVPAAARRGFAQFCFPRNILAEGSLPMICIRCGEPAVVLRSAHLRIYGIWLHVLGLLVRILISQASCFVVLPFCNRHKNHWTVRAFLPILCVVAALALIVASLLPETRDITDGFWPFAFLAFPIALVLSGILHYTSIHPVAIGEEAVILCGVSPAFLEALKRYRPLPLADQEYFQDRTGPG
jgi:hypothetical protein